VYELVSANGATETGWVGARVSNYWGPIANLACGTEYNGIHILHSLPFSCLKPAEFASGYHAAVQKTVSKIKHLFRSFGDTSTNIAEWEEFASNNDLYPTGGITSTEYVKVKPEKFIIPVFFRYLHDVAVEDQEVTNSSTLMRSRNATLNRNIINQLAVHSVRWPNNGNPQPYMLPRVNLAPGVELENVLNETHLLEQLRMNQLSIVANDFDNLPYQTLITLQLVCKHLNLSDKGTKAELELR
jgi:hypothetical protein